MGNFLDNADALGNVVFGAQRPQQPATIEILTRLYGTTDVSVIRDRLCTLGVPQCRSVPLIMALGAYGISAAQANGSAGGCSIMGPGCPGSMPLQPLADEIFTGAGPGRPVDNRGVFVLPVPGQPGRGLVIGAPSAPGIGGVAGAVGGGVFGGGVAAPGGVAVAGLLGGALAAGAKIAGKSLPFLLAAAEAVFLFKMFGGTNDGTGPVGATAQANLENFSESTYGVKTVSVNGQRYPRSLVRLWKDTRCSRLSHEVNLTRRLNPPEGRPKGTVMQANFEAKMNFLKKEQRDAGCIRASRSPRFGQRCCPTPQRRVPFRCCG